ncbi:hypothetical protein SAY86_031431 [Trapa natans]|uniref:Uncharacterized protein n=1 Tax=Trapa natans TaxID=22666 RepID=A0AAN7M3J5_TRANT|nr:hypothetical protein SAY86_031431 [Trapa natans]
MAADNFGTREPAIVKVIMCTIVNRKSIGGDCEVLLADTHHGDSPRLLYIYKRWVMDMDLFFSEAVTDQQVQSTPQPFSICTWKRLLKTLRDRIPDGICS